MMRAAQRRVPRRDPTFTRAFTAYETLVAVAVLAVIVAAVSSALAAGRQQARFAQDMVEANTLARGLLEKVMRDPTQVPAYQGYTDGPNTIKDEANQLYPANLQFYTRTVSVVAAQRTIVSPPWPLVPAGYDVTVTVSRDGQVLTQLTRFVLVPTG